MGGKYGTKIAFNYSYWAGLKGDFDLANFDYRTDFLGFGEKYFSDLSLEIRKKWSRNWSSIFYYVNQFYNRKFVEERSWGNQDQYFCWRIYLQNVKGKALRFELQHLWTQDDRKKLVGGTVEFNVNSSLAFYINDIYNYGSDNVLEKIHYYNVGSSYIFGAHRVP